jgi:hypothetical protein
MGMNAYFIIRYRPASEQIEPSYVCAAAALGLLFAGFLAFYIPLVKGHSCSARVS